MRRIYLLLLVFSLSAHAGGASDAAYIRDVEGLLNSVESRDPSRPQLTLKLADAVFNQALNLSGQPSLNEKEKQLLTSERRRAAQLYQESLSGLKGLFPAPSGSVRGKIQFQLARLYSDLGEMPNAEKIWKELAAQEALPDLQRESLLRLAEQLENRAGREDLNRAETYYKKALSLCSGQDVCSYSHYRLSWVYQRQGRLKDAVEEINLALWDSKGQVREESLRDLISFMGGIGDDGKDSLSKVEKLSAKLNRPQLISDMAEAYFAHGNRKAGVYLLDAVNRKQPTLKAYVRLMEEDYGFRDWQKFDAGLDGAEALHAKGAKLTDSESEKILRRLTVQLDGERVTAPKTAEQFKRTVMLYLALYPERTERKQMIDGWLAAETDNATKIKQLQIWIAEEQKGQRQTEMIRLRKIRAALAQKAKDYNTVAEEMSALKPFISGAVEKREASYQIAYAEYLNKDLTTAYPKFIELAAMPKGSFTPDKWAVLSENLALDILAQKKDYQAVIAQAQTWTKDPRFASWQQTLKDHRDEIADIKKVETSSEFEWATSLGSTPEALQVFSRDCMANVLLPQSCANAQILAVKLGDQKGLIEVLQKLGKKDELASELEASAEFADAAQLLEKKLKDKPATTRDYLKVALLYELGASKINRDRILHEMLAHLGAKPLGEEEDLILQTLKDSELINASILKMTWKKANREYLMDYLASIGKAGADVQNQLVKSCHDTGPAWKKVSIAELRRLDEKQKQIHFAGKSSKKKFEARVAALKQLMERGDCYLQSTTAEQRVIFATLLARSEKTLAEEIKASPIPEGVDEDGKASLQKALAEMAQPFLDKGQEFEKLASAQLEKIENVAEREALKAKVDAQDDQLYTLNPVATSHAEPLKSAEPQGADVFKTAMTELHHNPNRRESLAQLKSYYESNGNTRLAAYFQGRLLQLGEEVKQ